MKGGVQRGAVTAAYIAACRLDVRALKPGNVHVFADGHRMSVADFDTSADVSAPFVCHPAMAVGTRIRRAVEATFNAVGQNTNLGILLLSAPLAAAAERSDPSPLEERLQAVLAGLTHDDARQVYSAIAYANPAGLGKAEAGDVHAPPPADWTLLDAMRAAATHDMIAAEYATGFNGVFEAAAEFSAERHAGAGREDALAFVFLRQLASRADTHIVRKHGTAFATRVQNRASDVLSSLGALRATSLAETCNRARLIELDAELKSWGANPGSLADLMCAAAFASELVKLLANANGK